MCMSLREIICYPTRGICSNKCKSYDFETIFQILKIFIFKKEEILQVLTIAVFKVNRHTKVLQISNFLVTL